jgi:hypothetical protein
LKIILKEKEKPKRKTRKKKMRAKEEDEECEERRVFFLFFAGVFVLRSLGDQIWFRAILEW